MILDKVFHGVLDQGRGCLLVFDEPEGDVRFVINLGNHDTDYMKPTGHLRRSDSDAGTSRESCRFVVRKSEHADRLCFR